LGESVNETRNEMNKLKNIIEQIKMDKAMKQLNANNNNDTTSDNNTDMDNEKDLLKQMDTKKKIYRNYYKLLKEIKIEIEHTKHVLGTNRKRIQIAFELWWKNYSLTIDNNKTE